MKTPTIQDVLDAFDALEGAYCHANALKAQLEKQRFRVDDVVTAINATLEARALVMDVRTGSIHKPAAQAPETQRADVQSLPAPKTK